MSWFGRRPELVVSDGSNDDPDDQRSEDEIAADDAAALASRMLVIGRLPG